MAMAIAGLYADSPITIDDISAVSVTFPTFFDLIEILKSN
jgi:5-enolpyruvylshikimate-3-phosphate synthase